MNEERRPGGTETANTVTTKSTSASLRLPSVARVRLAAAWGEHAKTRALAAELAEHRANGGTR